ncbi:unnamed protein product [Alopecurus aequalis]
MAAALRALRRLAAASPSRILPSSLPGPSPKLSAAVASRLPYTRGANSSPALVLSVLRRYCSARDGGSTSGLASVRRANASPLQVPSLLPVRHHGSTSTKQLNSLEQCSDEEAVQFALEKLQDVNKSLTQLKRIMLLKVVLLGMFLHFFYLLFFRLRRDVAALEEKVAKLESRQILERKLVQKSDSC